MGQVMKSRDNAENHKNTFLGLWDPWGFFAGAPRVPAEGRQHKSASGLNCPSRMESGEPNKVPKIHSQGCRTVGVLAGTLWVAAEDHQHKAAVRLSDLGHGKS